jgi:hypothetical protein
MDTAVNDISVVWDLKFERLWLLLERKINQKIYLGKLHYILSLRSTQLLFGSGRDGFHPEICF